MSIKTTSRRAGILIAGASALVLAAPVAVHASSGCTVTNVWGTALGRGTFTSDGEIFTIKDLRADGMWVQIGYTTVNGSGMLRNTGGSGTTKTLNLSLPEGSKVTYTVSAGDAEGTHFFSSLVTDKA